MNSSVALKIIVFSSLFVSGCVRVPEHDLAQPATQVVYEEVGLANDESPAIPQEWWKELQDDVLNHLMETGISLSPTLKSAEEKLKAAYEVALQKKAVLYPELDLDIQDTWYHLSKYGFFRAFAPSFPAVVNDFSIGLTFHYEFDFWGKNRDLFKAALSRTLAVTAERAQAELILTTSIAYTYVELQFLLFQKQILKQREANERMIEEIRQSRENLALDTSIQKHTSQLSCLDVADLLITVEKEIELHVHKLKSLAGLNQNVKLDLPYEEWSPEKLRLPKTLPLDLISRRPDLVAQKAVVEAYAQEIGAAKTDFYPNINLMAFVGLESVFWSKLFRASSFSANVAPAFHLPLFTAGRLKAQLNERVSQYNTAVYDYNALILNASQEIADRLTDLSQIQKEIEVRTLSLEASQSILHLTRRRFQHAIDDQIDVLMAENATLSNELVLGFLKYSQQLETILLIRALGGGYNE